MRGGNGRFLEVMARAMEVDLDEFGDLSCVHPPSTISSLCTVFAESEVISLISKGETRENIIAGFTNRSPRESPQWRYGLAYCGPL